jgi:hypothetical protein
MKITEEYVDSLIQKAETKEFIVWNKAMVVAYRLPNNFILFGTCGVIDPAEFDFKTGMKICYEDAKDQLWLLLGYKAQCDLAEPYQS